MTRDERVIAVMKSFDKTDYSFDAKPKDNIPFTFTYSGDELVEGYSAGCGCTSVTLKDNVVSGILNISDTAHGEIIRTVDIFMKDGQPFKILKNSQLADNPEKVKLTLRLIANVS